jgi:hypothetical protein
MNKRMFESFNKNVLKITSSSYTRISGSQYLTYYLRDRLCVQFYKYGDTAGGSKFRRKAKRTR